MRTVEEIIKRCQRNSDPLGFGDEALALFLTFDEAQPIIRPDALAWAGAREWWDAETKPRTREAVLAEMREYMDLAWQTVRYHRGISAGRSVEKMKAWVWLLRDATDIDWDNYAQYGAPILMRICEVYGFNIPLDEGNQRMAAGKPCRPGCEEGCGR
jgi:hypothetical protein